jgi:hypothetical protein
MNVAKSGSIWRRGCNIVGARHAVPTGVVIL